MNRSGGVGGGVDDTTLETISAAATAIVTAEIRNTPTTTVQKRRWGGCLSLWACFGSPKPRKRIIHAVLAPEPAAARADGAVSENPIQVPSIVLPFAAPPSSPTSLLTSEAPSATQSPAGGLSLAAISASMYSSGRPASMFAIGPYAYETQLVTPPTFSNLTTESSTAPVTPPPESVYTTTPSSPEVPFAFLLDPVNQNGEEEQAFPFSPDEFQSYLISPGSPVSYLISPGSGISSPLPDGDHSHDIGNDGNSKIRGSKQASGDRPPEVANPGNPTKGMRFGQYLDATSLGNLHNSRIIDETVVENRVSFEITAEEVRKCAEKKPAAVPKGVLSPLTDGVCDIFRNENKLNWANGRHTCCAGEASCDASNSASTDGEIDRQHEKHWSLALEISKEFNFSSIDGVSSERPNICSDWWADKKVIGDKGGAGNSWSFFPVTQPGFR